MFTLWALREFMQVQILKVFGLIAHERWHSSRLYAVPNSDFSACYADNRQVSQWTLYILAVQVFYGKMQTNAEINLCLLLRYPLGIFLYGMNLVQFNSEKTQVSALTTKKNTCITSPVFEITLKAAPSLTFGVTASIAIIKDQVDLKETECHRQSDAVLIIKIPIDPVQSRISLIY